MICIKFKDLPIGITFWDYSDQGDQFIKINSEELAPLDRTWTQKWEPECVVEIEQEVLDAWYQREAIEAWK